MSISTPNLTEQILHKDQQIATLEAKLAWSQLLVKKLEALLREQRIQQFGPKSEKLSDLQLELLMEEPSVTAGEVEAESKREAIKAKTARTRQSHPGRNPLPAHLPRVTETIVCAPEACRCAACGGETVVIGHDESEQLAKEPAKYFVRVTRREKRACRACAQGTVVAAPLPERIIEKSLASDELIIDILVGKYCDHLPLYRQEAILEREAGVEISRSTLDDWVMTVGERLQPVTMAMRQELLAAPYLQADETTVPVQMRDQRGSHHEAYFWQYGQPGGATVFEFSLTRSGDVPRRFLGDYAGMLQTDGYQVYDGIGGPELVHLGCWAHARRKFVDAVKVNPADKEAEAMVVRMDALFLIDRSAREEGLSPDERLVFRQQNAPEWTEAIHAACWRLAPRVLPASTLGKAITYTVRQWDKLQRCLEYPLAELSNNLAENSMRPVALGRKNWLHIGSEKAGPKVAAILSIVESCRRLRLPVREYLAAVLPGLDRRTLPQVRQLTPTAWAAKRG